MCNSDKIRYFEVQPQGREDVVGRLMIDGETGYLQLVGVPQVFVLSEHQPGTQWSAYTDMHAIGVDHDIETAAVSPKRW